MQTHYFELRAIPQIDLTQNTIMTQFMQVLHRILINYDGDIGISFPCYNQKCNKTFGGIIRFFGSKENLIVLFEEMFNVPEISNYGLLFEIKEIPIKIKGYLQLVRIRQKGHSDLRRAEKRLSQKGKWTEQIKQQMITKWGSKILNYPHFHLKSSSTNQNFILWIKQINCNKQEYGKFNSYGLSMNATVPDF